MIKLVNTLRDPNGVVSKLIFEGRKRYDDVIAETVAYKYEDRGVICLSVQSGCRVGCSFCGTGKRFIRNLTAYEMYEQLREGLNEIGARNKIQVMLMSMGEPMDNWFEVSNFITSFFINYPKYHLYISTVGLDDQRILNDFVLLGRQYKNFGLQFSLHNLDNAKRKKLLGNYPKLADLEMLLAFGRYWTSVTDKRCYWNYICNGKEDSGHASDVSYMLDTMHLTCSVLCNTHGLVKTDANAATRFAEMVNYAVSSNMTDVEVSVFDPAGQDTVGGGCGQLLYVQNKLCKKS